MGSQIDLGYDLKTKCWFLNMMDELRWNVGSMSVKKNNLTLKDVLCDTYSFPDQNERTSHGRLRFYDGHQINSKGTASFHDSIEVEGPNSDPLKFISFDGPAILRYNPKSYDWSIEVDGNSYTTKNIVGKLTGKCEDDPKIVFKMENCKILYSTMVTLINTNLARTENKVL